MKIKNIIFSLLAIFSLVSCADKVEPIIEGYRYPDDGLPKEIDPETIVLKEGCTHTKLQMAYIESTYKSIEKYANGQKENSIPNPIKVDYSSLNLSSVDNYKIEFSTSATFENSYVDNLYDLRSYDFYNGLTDTKYYWQIKDNEGNILDLKGDFKTCEHLPRMLKVEGVTNVRDLGGYKTKDNKKIKQGLLYRGGRLNDSYTYEPKLGITEKGIEVLTKQLGVKSELDLRRLEEDDKNAQEAGHRNEIQIPGISLKSVSLDYSIKSELQKELFVEIFDYLADENNYPLYFHCNIGTDRTGLIAFWLLNLAGVEETTIYKEYCVSALANIGQPRTHKSLQKEWLTLYEYDHEDFTKATELYLKDLGIKEETLNKIKSIILE